MSKIFFTLNYIKDQHTTNNDENSSFIKFVVENILFIVINGCDPYKIT